MKMALIVPFRGISYDPPKAGDLNRVVAPPYDVISPEAQDALYRRHPQNVVRLILNQETPQDTPRITAIPDLQTFIGPG